MHAQRRGCRTSKAADFLAIGIKEIEQTAGGLDSLLCRLGNAMQEELEPALPFSLGADQLKELVISIPVRLAIEADVIANL